MTAEKRQTYTAEFTREAVRLVLAHGYAITEAPRNLGINATMLGRWNVKLRHKRTGCFQAKSICQLTRKNSTAYARSISASAWSARF
jgi:transposase-like protein